MTKIYCQVRVTNLHDASEHIGEVLKRVKKEHLQRAYRITEWYGTLSPRLDFHVFVMFPFLNDIIKLY